MYNFPLLKERFYWVSDTPRELAKAESLYQQAWPSALFGG